MQIFLMGQSLYRMTNVDVMKVSSVFPYPAVDQQAEHSLCRGADGKKLLATEKSDEATQVLKNNEHQLGITSSSWTCASCAAQLPVLRALDSSSLDMLNSAALLLVISVTLTRLPLTAKRLTDMPLMTGISSRPSGQSDMPISKLRHLAGQTRRSLDVAVQALREEQALVVLGAGGDD